MLIRSKRRWELKESLATPEQVFFSRRQAIALGAGAALLAACGGEAKETAGTEAAPSDKLYPFPRNEKFTLDREMTDEEWATTYNNFYEFGSHKRISRAAQALEVRPWEVQIDGMVVKPMTVGIDDLIAKMPLEERLYRHRCVEAWAMAVPWSGFPMKALVEMAEPLGSATFVRMETFENPKVAPGQKQSWYPWPYIEGLTVAEATNELAFLATGIYGKPLPPQSGAPLRLAVPWKYGFKSIKSIVRFTFTDEQPLSFWEKVQASEYGFYANVNPEVPHKRWSQATEELLGTGGKRVPTQLYNGYAEEVASLYAGIEPQKLFY